MQYVTSVLVVIRAVSEFIIMGDSMLKSAQYDHLLLSLIVFFPNHQLLGHPLSAFYGFACLLLRTFFLNNQHNGDPDTGSNNKGRKFKMKDY